MQERMQTSVTERGSAVIFGAGSVGRGFLGQLFSESGYRVVFVPAGADGEPGSEWEIFADGFRKEGLVNRDRTARPVGLAMGPDGSLFISDSFRGRIWRVVYRGS